MSNKHKKGFTLVELIIVTIFLGIFAAIAIPRLNYGIITKFSAETTAKKITADLRRCRMLAISNAANNTQGYQLKMVGSSPYQSYQIVDLSTSAVVDSHPIPDKLQCTGDSTIDFGPLGNLKSGSGDQLTISSQGKTVTLDLIAATGIVKCTVN